MTPLIAFAIQMSHGASAQAFITLAIGISPIAVCLAALYKRTAITKLNRLDKWCIACSGVGIILWVASNNPLTMLIMSMAADFFSNLPTIRKSYLAPHTEHAVAYAITMASMAIGLLTITDWQLSNWFFQAYILAVNLAIWSTIVLWSKLHHPLQWHAQHVDSQD